MEHLDYLNRLYPLQDRVLGIINAIDTGFYLTGGTATSRGYLNHRFSDDLDLFVNDDGRFELWADRVIYSLRQHASWKLDVGLKETRYVRLEIVSAELTLKIELVNDVPSRVGEPIIHPVLGRIDTPENILANKITALIDREAPKDLADIWGFCVLRSLPISEAITGAQGKAIGIFPPDLARILCSARRQDWEYIKWISPPDPDKYVEDLHHLGEGLLAQN